MSIRAWSGSAFASTLSLLAILIATPSLSRANLTCDKPTIQGIAPANTTITSAIETALGVPFPPTPYCQVIGFVTTTNPGPNQVNFEVGLPDASNGRFVFWGNGGDGGSFQAIANGLFQLTVSLGFVTAVTDTGHQGGVFDSSWAFHNFPAQDDFLIRAVHVTTIAGQAITKAFYALPTLNSYFIGCSTGGRQALVEAEQFPNDYNGIIAGAPGIGVPAAGFIWNQEANLKSTDTLITTDAIQLVDAAVLSSCDGTDGVVDGLIQDPRKCTFDVATLQCTGANVPPGCLTAGQVGTFKAIYAGARAGNGMQLYPGFMKSDPGQLDGWASWITGFVNPPPFFGSAEPWGSNVDPFSGGAPFEWTSADGVLKFFSPGADPNFNLLTFDFGEGADVSRLLNNFHGFNGENPNLSAFVHAGHKLILWHGFSDPGVTPLISINYYNSVVNAMGGGFARAQQSARLFMVPGVRHCGGGPGPDNFDLLGPLIGWVEFGSAPDVVIASHTGF